MNKNEQRLTEKERRRIWLSITDSLICSEAAFNAVANAIESAILARLPAASEAGPYTYVSTQETNCAGCGKHKHTPLRIDAMGGYVCLTCIDQKIGSLLGEFGYPDASEAGAVPGTVVGTGKFPAGAITNGRILAERLESYQLMAGDILGLRADWVEFRHCFEYLAEWSQLAAPPAQPDYKEAAQVARDMGANSMADSLDKAAQLEMQAGILPPPCAMIDDDLTDDQFRRVVRGVVAHHAAHPSGNSGELDALSELRRLLGDLDAWFLDLAQANFDGWVPQSLFSEGGDFAERIEAIDLRAFELAAQPSGNPADQPTRTEREAAQRKRMAERFAGRTGPDTADFDLPYANDAIEESGELDAQGDVDEFETRLNELISDFAKACTFGDDAQKRAAAGFALRQYYRAALARQQGGGDAEDSARLDALESTAGEDKWIVVMNKDSFTVYLRPRHHATRKTLRQAIDGAAALLGEKGSDHGNT